MEKRIIVCNSGSEYLLSEEPIVAGTRIYEAVAVGQPDSNPSSWGPGMIWSMLQTPVEFDLDTLEEENYKEVGLDLLRAEANTSDTPAYRAYIRGEVFEVDDSTAGLFSQQNNTIRVLNAEAKELYFCQPGAWSVIPGRVLSELFAAADPKVRDEFFRTGVVAVQHDFWKPLCLSNTNSPWGVSKIAQLSTPDNIVMSGCIGVVAKYTNSVGGFGITYNYVWDWMELVGLVAKEMGLDVETHKVGISHALSNNQVFGSIRLLPLAVVADLHRQACNDPFSLFARPQSGGMVFQSNPLDQNRSFTQMAAQRNPHESWDQAQPRSVF